MLHELQQDFLTGLFDPQQQLPILQYIKQMEGKTAADQFAIYRGSVTGGLTKALAEIYAVCQKLVGKEFFDAIIGHFISHQRSYSPDLNDYGAQLSEFIGNFPAAASLPYLADVARLEWAWHRAFNGEDAPHGDLDSLSKLDQDQYPSIIFHLAKNCALLESVYPIHRIWETNQDDFKGDKQVNLDEGGVRLIIWRHGLTMHMDPLDDAQWALLTELNQQQFFAHVCEKFSQIHTNDDIGTVLSSILQRGWITSFST